jgi:hypothetical protein
MRLIQKFALAYIVALIFMGYGFSIARYQVFPYQQVLELEKFLKNDGDNEELSIADKVKSDLDIFPSRAIVKHPLNPTRQYSEIPFPQARDRRRPPLVYRTAGARRGYRVIFGTLDFEEGLHGAMLLDGKDRVKHTWITSEDGLEYMKVDDTNKAPHDLEVLPDGSIVFTYMFGNSLQRVDWCGNRIWAIKGPYHHNFSLSSDGSLWALKQFAAGLSAGFVQLDINDGRILRTISFKQIMEANPEIDILGIRQKDGKRKSRWANDYWHDNDVDVLTRDLASSFEQFSEGDLLISLRSLNLIFVVNPDDLKVKWWRVGVARRQHDPDWQEDGTISIYDNNMHREISRIVEIDPVTYESRIVYSGEKEDFYSYRRGNHQVLENGNILIVVSEQGRVLEVNAAGETVYEFINRYQDGENLALTDAIHLPESFLNLDELEQCPRQ